VAGISALVYGSQSAIELRVRGLASFDPAAADSLDALFDRRISYVHKAF
jgi:hypothetical protein